ncbi:hypothetical protein HNP33_003699 [Comamonas odontotermitis]|uniref:Uncharacterized protein n=1 Tax=Comamonas odontotermitis TaxID=379895 RepID=A0ABR6RK75_9BURK|nr:hypothetical protein [Comamonas odontotermitis]MBB6579585.1 hypothetical protein [Comamonas odontotermitis]
MNDTAGTNLGQGMPKSGQLAEMFLTIAADKLKSLQSIRENDEQWTEADVNVDFAIDLAVDHIRAMTSRGFNDSGVFVVDWYKAAAAVELSLSAFSRPSCWYGRSLKVTAEFFRQAPELFDYASS